jgi:hypothetical protein
VTVSDGHSKNFSNPLAAKDARTCRPSHQPQHLVAVTSPARAHRTSMVTTRHLHTTTESYISLGNHPIHQIRLIFSPRNLASKARFYHPQARTHAHLFTIQAHMCARLCFTAHAHFMSAPIHHTNAC